MLSEDRGKTEIKGWGIDPGHFHQMPGVSKVLGEPEAHQSEAIHFF